MNDDLTISIMVFDVGLWAWAGTLALARSIRLQERRRKKNMRR